MSVLQEPFVVKLRTLREPVLHDRNHELSSCHKQLMYVHGRQEIKMKHVLKP